MSSAAFLALDFTSYIVDNFVYDRAVIDRAAQALQRARDGGLPIFHVVPEPMREDIHPAMMPMDGETILGKTSIGAFATTPLRDHLVAASVESILVAGIATSGTVLSTSRWAFDIGYRVVIAVDACDDPDPGAHAALTDATVFPNSWLGLWRIADVQPFSEIDVLAKDDSQR